MAIPRAAYPAPFNITRASHVVLLVKDLGASRAFIFSMILAEALQLPMAQAFRIEQDYGCLNIIAYGPTWTTVRLING